MSQLGRLRALASDPGVRATAASRVIALVGAPVSLYLAATRLAPVSQGYYFVAVNIVAMAQLFELGLGTILVQFASHEWPRLRWGRGGGLEGDPAARDAVAAVIIPALRWYGVAALTVFAIAGAGGAVLFGSPAGGSFAVFLVPWCGFVALTGLYLMIIPFVCVAEGCGDLVAVQKMRSWQSAAVLLALWTGIVTSGPLMAAWLAAAAQLVVAALWLARRHPGLLRAPRSLPAILLDSARGLPARYRVEQGRSAQLWLALHLAPQLLAPVLLKVRGGDEAGRLGVTVALALAPLTVGVAWLHGRYPAFGALVADGLVREFDALARRAIAEAAAVFAASAVMLVGAVMLLPFILPGLAVRVLPLVVLLALLGGSLAGLLLQGMAAYLRAFRDEGLAPTIVAGTAIIVAASTAGAVMGGARLMAFAYAVSSLGIALPLALAHFRRFRRERMPAQTS